MKRKFNKMDLTAWLFIIPSLIFITLFIKLVIKNDNLFFAKRFIVIINKDTI